MLSASLLCNRKQCTLKQPRFVRVKVKVPTTHTHCTTIAIGIKHIMLLHKMWCIVLSIMNCSITCKCEFFVHEISRIVAGQHLLEVYAAFV